MMPAEHREPGPVRLGGSGHGAPVAEQPSKPSLPPSTTRGRRFSQRTTARLAHVQSDSTRPSGGHLLVYAARGSQYGQDLPIYMAHGPQHRQGLPVYTARGPQHGRICPST